MYLRLTTTFAITALVLAGCARTNDADVISTVFEDFSARSDINSVYPNGVTLVARETETWSPDRFTGFTLDRQKDPCKIAPDLYERFFERNSSSGSAVALVVPDRRWRFVAPQELDFTNGVPLHTPTGEDIRTVIDISYPAYSSSGDTAYLMFFFTAAHTAIAQYVVTKAENGWVVQCSRLHFYV